VGMPSCETRATGPTGVAREEYGTARDWEVGDEAQPEEVDVSISRAGLARGCSIGEPLPVRSDGVNGERRRIRNLSRCIMAVCGGVGSMSRARVDAPPLLRFYA
jgi:hypothetical protein